MYASLDEATAIAEKTRNERRRGINPGDYPAGEWWAYEIAFDLEYVLDLTDAKALAILEMGEETLLGEGRTRTQQIAREARAAGFQGLLVPSAAAQGGKNLVVFTDMIRGEPLVLTSRPVRLE